MTQWVNVNERMPIVNGITKIRVKLEVGSVEKKVVEREVLVKPWCGKTRFMVGDWQTVTHWCEE